MQPGPGLYEWGGGGLGSLAASRQGVVPLPPLPGVHPEQEEADDEGQAEEHRHVLRRNQGGDGSGEGGRGGKRWFAVLTVVPVGRAMGRLDPNGSDVSVTTYTEWGEWVRWSWGVGGALPCPPGSGRWHSPGQPRRRRVARWVS